MSPRAFALATLFLTAASVSIAAVPTRRFTITARHRAAKGEYLAVQKGQLGLGSPSLTGDGGLDETDAPDRWYVLGSKIKSSVAGQYMAYDPSGKDNRVFLASKPEREGTDWVVRRLEGGKRKNEANPFKGAEW